VILDQIVSLSRESCSLNGASEEGMSFIDDCLFRLVPIENLWLTVSAGWPPDRGLLLQRFLYWRATRHIVPEESCSDYRVIAKLDILTYLNGYDFRSQTREMWKFCFFARIFRDCSVDSICSLHGHSFLIGMEQNRCLFV
jgi:hypothetical protein